MLIVKHPKTIIVGHNINLVICNQLAKVDKITCCRPMVYEMATHRPVMRD